MAGIWSRHDSNLILMRSEEEMAGTYFDRGSERAGN